MFVPYFFVYNWQIVLSDSMSPSFWTGDLILVQRTHLTPERLAIGDVVVYRHPFGFTTIHRIYSIRQINGSYYFAFKGDANPQPDFIEYIERTQNIIVNSKVFDPTLNANISVTFYPFSVIQGKVVFRIPLIGWIFAAFFSKIQLFSFLIVILAFFTLIYAVSKRTKYKKDLEYYLSLATLKRLDEALKEEFSFLKILSSAVIIILFINFFLISSVITQDVLEEETIHSFDIAINETAIQFNMTYEGRSLLEIADIFLLNTTKSILNVTLFNNNSTNSTEMGKINLLKQITINSAKSKTIKTLYFYYTEIIDRERFVFKSSSASDPNLHTFIYYFLLPQETKNYSAGIHVRNFYIPPKMIQENVPFQINGTTYKTILIEEKLQFIQDLVEYKVHSRFYYDIDTGLLLFRQLKATLTTWILPDIIFDNAALLLTIFLYYLINLDHKKWIKKTIKTVLAETPVNEEE